MHVQRFVVVLIIKKIFLYFLGNFFLPHLLSNWKKNIQLQKTVCRMEQMDKKCFKFCLFVRLTDWNGKVF